MKKILAILFSVFYFGFSSGAVFSVHYCMKEFASISQKVDDVCSKCGVKTKKDCCKTEIKVVKVDDSQKSDFLKIDFLKQIQKFSIINFSLLTVFFGYKIYSDSDQCTAGIPAGTYLYQSL
jgi:hypothetical protein